MRVLLAGTALLTPLIIGSLMIDKSPPQTATANVLPKSNNVLDLREETKTAIENLKSNGHLTPNNTPVSPKIQQCNGVTGNANIRRDGLVVGIISVGTEYHPTGRKHDNQVEVEVSFWPNGENHPIEGNGWIHECWTDTWAP